MKVAFLVVAGVALILWLRFTHRNIDPPAWKPVDHGINNNRGDRR